MSNPKPDTFNLIKKGDDLELAAYFVLLLLLFYGLNWSVSKPAELARSRSTMTANNATNTLFMTPAETERIQKTVRDRMQKCIESTGQPRQPNHRQTLISQGTSASLMSDIDFGMGEAPKNRPDTMVVFTVGCEYPPSTALLRDLKPMELSELRMETHHRGRVLSLRRVSPVVEIVASSWTIVQGDSGDEVERLEVYLHKSAHGKDILDSGSEFLVKEPYFTLNNQGEPTIRIDHPSDLVVSADNKDDPEVWRKVNGDLNGAPSNKTAAMCKDEGNAALKKKAFVRAHASYTEGLKLVASNNVANESLSTDLSRNRSFVNLLLQRYDEAKTDALASLTHIQDENNKSLDSKAYSRAGTAAYSLGDFEEARGFFEEQVRLQPEDKEANINLRRVELRLKEQATGVYDFNKIVSRLSKARRRVDTSSFEGSIEVRESPGAGRGLFATRDLDANEIILSEKAFCIVWGLEAEAWTALTCDLRDDAEIRVFPAGLSQALVKKLLNNPSQIEKVMDLHGEYQGIGNKRHDRDGRPVIDAFQVHDIVQRNAFGPGPQFGEKEDVSNVSTGLWVRAAYINHSCLSNATKDFVGDLMVLRATNRIAAGEEITHTYDDSTDYDARTAKFKSTWGFKCTCALCVAEEADGPELRKKRQELESLANSLAEQEDSIMTKRISLVKARRLRQSISDTYDDKRYSGLPRRSLLQIDHWLSEASRR